MFSPHAPYIRHPEHPIQHPLDPELLTRFGVRHVELAAQSAIADIWRAEISGGSTAALKVYHGGNMQDESAGFALLSDVGQDLCPKIIKTGAGWVLMEWLDGTSLADLSRGGADRDAAHAMATLAQAFIKRAKTLSTALPVFSNQLSSLFAAKFTVDCDKQCQDDIRRAQVIARRLLATQEAAQPLHGDFHHGNVIQTNKGDRVFDAKGVIGDPALELGQAMFNPLDAPALVHDPARVAMLLDIFSEGLSVSRTRLLGWTIVKLALTTVWSAQGSVRVQADATLSAILHALWTKESPL